MKNTPAIVLLKISIHLWHFIIHSLILMSGELGLMIQFDDGGEKMASIDIL